MKPEIHDILVLYDEKDHWEYPKDFNRTKQMNIIREAKMKFEKIFNCKLSIDEYVQDASFTTDISLYSKNETNSLVISSLVTFRFSNFGKLFTIFNNSRNYDKKLYAKIQMCKDILENLKFTYTDSI